MNLESIEYSTKPMTLGEHILSEKSGKGDWEAMAAYIVARTSLTEEEALSLTDAELLPVITEIGKAVLQSIYLQQIADVVDASS